MTMKEFRTLREAFEHREFCPLCRGVVGMNYQSHDFSDGIESITFLTGSFTVKIDYNSDDLLTLQSEGTSIKGMLLFRVLGFCNTCSKYGCVFQVHIETIEGKLKGVYFNSESLSIERGPYLYEIRNSYTDNKTEYTVFNNYGSDKNIKQNNSSLVLPLIPLDVECPTKTLDRIKGLVIFS